ncbi:oxidoreductase [Ascidiimonas sp. W6]|uniref:WD40/YVTN/BNR-like repeat-containing protein n=1 Tax=Ascidiimonas meishanensis TaxID=3128903 RepID=UPI0030EE4825
MQISEVEVTELYVDSLSVRAIAVGQHNFAFAGSNGYYGLYDSVTGVTKVNQQLYDTLTPSFRAVAFTETDFFMLSIASPALLFKTGLSGKMDLVYKEEGEGVFYDAMHFWNHLEGIAIGDPVEGCLSIIITRDGGFSWEKLSCDQLLPAKEGEAAFAASNSNIAVFGDHTWIATGGKESRVFYSPNKGIDWEVFTTPFTQGTNTQGIYSIAFYDDKNGFAIGGDYTDPANNKGNKAVTKDGGRSWQLVADGKYPGYKSCVQYVPGSQGKSLIAIGFTGIAASNDGGTSWEELSKEGFYTLRFVNDSTAYAAGKNRLARLDFK